jgi:plasmid stabilization system protein ParE
MKDSISLLSENPTLGVTCKKKNIDLDCRVFIYEAYLIFYKVLKYSILVIRLLRASVNYKKILV